jgi:hypothetical protein
VCSSAEVWNAEPSAGCSSLLGVVAIYWFVTRNIVCRGMHVDQGVCLSWIKNLQEWQCVWRPASFTITFSRSITPLNPWDKSWFHSEGKIVRKPLHWLEKKPTGMPNLHYLVLNPAQWPRSLYSCPVLPDHGSITSTVVQDHPELPADAPCTKKKKKTDPLCLHDHLNKWQWH